MPTRHIKYYYAKVLKKLRGVAIKNSYVDETSKIESGTQFINSTMNKHSFCGYDCDISSCNIGSFTSIANNVIIGGGMHPIDWVGMSPVFYEGRDSVKTKFSKHQREDIKLTTIEHDVWIGQNVMIKQGITIGTGAIIGMGSIVVKNVESYTIVAGNPTRIIRKRFEDEIISKLLQSKWWEFEDSKLYKYAKYFKEPKVFLNELKNEKNTNTI